MSRTVVTSKKIIPNIPLESGINGRQICRAWIRLIMYLIWYVFVILAEMGWMWIFVSVYRRVVVTLGVGVGATGG